MNQLTPPPPELAKTDISRVRALLDQALSNSPILEPHTDQWTQRTENMPQFSWKSLQRQLLDLAGSPTKQEMVPHLVSALRKQARLKPREMVLREILCMSWALLDEDFQPEPSIPALQNPHD